MADKYQRLKLFFEKVASHKPFISFDDAYNTMQEIMHEIEINEIEKMVIPSRELFSQSKSLLHSNIFSTFCVKHCVMISSSGAVLVYDLIYESHPITDPRNYVDLGREWIKFEKHDSTGNSIWNCTI